MAVWLLVVVMRSLSKTAFLAFSHDSFYLALFSFQHMYRNVICSQMRPPKGGGTPTKRRKVPATKATLARITNENTDQPSNRNTRFVARRSPPANDVPLPAATYPFVPTTCAMCFAVLGVLPLPCVFMRVSAH